MEVERGREMTDQETFEARRMAVADEILDRPENFNMFLWASKTACGTVACLAGTAALQAQREGLCQTLWESVGYGEERLKFVALPDGSLQRVGLWAYDYLGLTDRDAQLFGRFEMTPEVAAKALLEAAYRIEEQL